MTTLAIIGGGSWGTALSVVLAPRFDKIRLWFHEPELAESARRTRINEIFLPGTVLPGNIKPISDLATAVEDADFLLSVMPSHFVRAIYAQIFPLLRPDMRIVSATKGLEMGSFLRASAVIREVIGPDRPVAVLSGPSFAREVAEGKPTALVVASDDAELAREVQQGFSGPTFRLYLSDDPIGVEIGGALKNVIAIGAGICDGLALGHNAVAALITRGLAELTRLATAAGAKAETLSGLAGLGDLVLTCTGDLSRNRQVGLRLAAGDSLENILKSTPMVAEGVKTASAAIELGRRFGADLPITQEMHAVLNLGRSPHEAIQRLMSRTLRSERG